MSSPSSSAQAQLQGLADRLRDLRVDAGLTGIALAADLGWHRTKVSRIENGSRPPKPADVRAWCRACGADDQVDDLVEALRSYEGAYVQWQRLQRTGLRRLQDSYLPMYERTRVLRVYASMVIPGHLQTPDYIRALFAVISRRRGTRSDVEEAIDARMTRRRVLHEGDHRFAFLLEESALHAGLGGAAVMAAQLRHLLDIMSLPSVSLGVLPANPGRQQWHLEMFTMYDLEQVEIELLSARVTITAPSEIKLYASAWDDLHAMAVHGDAARKLITSALDDLDA